MIAAKIPMTTSILWGDQPMAKEGSIFFIMVGIPWDVSPGPRTIIAVANMKISVVDPNMNICPGELKKEPLELKGL